MAEVYPRNASESLPGDSERVLRKKIESRLTQMDAKIAFLHDGVKGLADSHKGFQEEMTDFMAFIADGLADHEKRISDLERKN